MMHKGVNMETERTISVSHRELDLIPVPLGFVNARNDMVFVCRKPMRRSWRQGLARNNMMTYGSLSAEEIPFKLLSQPIRNQYPSFEKALGLIGKKSSVAFSREFGLSALDKGEVGIVYRKDLVGKVEKGQAVLSRNKFFLQEHLDDDMRKKA